MGFQIFMLNNWFYQLKNLDTSINLLMLISAIIGFYVLLRQNGRTKKIEQYKFLLDAEVYFSNHEKIQKIYKKLLAYDKKIKTSPELELGVGDIEYISAYLTFFETFYPLVKNKFFKLLHYKEIDSQFGYRFFVAVHNKFVQDIEIYPDWKHYTNLRKLYNGWLNYKIKTKKDIFHNEEDIILDLKYNALENNIIFKNIKSDNPIKQNYKIRKCDIKDYEKIVSAQMEILEEQNGNRIFIDTANNVIKDYLNDSFHFVVLGAFIDEFVCAYLFLITAPDHVESLNKYVFDINEKNYDKTATLDTIAVLPAYRGNGLQRTLTQKACKLAKENEFVYIAASVSPYNNFSLNNMFKEGFLINQTTSLHNEERFILSKKL